MATSGLQDRAMSARVTAIYIHISLSLSHLWYILEPTRGRPVYSLHIYNFQTAIKIQIIKSQFKYVNFNK